MTRINENEFDYVVDMTSPLITKVEREFAEENISSTNAATSTVADTDDIHQPISNFIIFSILFSANHGSVVSCLSLASARFGTSLSSIQSSTMYLSYTLSSLLLSVFVTKRIGSRNALGVGMALYSCYVACFVLLLEILPHTQHLTPMTSSTAASSAVSHSRQTLPIVQYVCVIVGAIIGGLGAGILWTAQGSYFTQSSLILSTMRSSIPLDDATSYLGGIFAFIYLVEEVMLRLASSILIEFFSVSWIGIYVFYTMVAFFSAIGTQTLKSYTHCSNLPTSHPSPNTLSSSISLRHNMTIVIQLLYNDIKMKYMIPIVALFGFTSSFVTSFVNGEVVRIVLSDTTSVSIGVFTSVTAAVAAIMSLLFCFIQRKTGNGPILFIGCFAFFTVPFIFMLKPILSHWTASTLVTIYACQGIGRATFEGTLRAEFARLFHDEKEGAFGCLVFLSGIVGAIGFFLSGRLYCSRPGLYCIPYADGTLHSTLSFELIIMISAVIAIVGYLRLRWIMIR